jgi:hypothetical protein
MRWLCWRSLRPNRHKKYPPSRVERKQTSSTKNQESPHARISGPIASVDSSVDHLHFHAEYSSKQNKPTSVCPDFGVLMTPHLSFRRPVPPYARHNSLRTQDFGVRGVLCLRRNMALSRALPELNLMRSEFFFSAACAAR